MVALLTPALVLEIQDLAPCGPWEQASVRFGAVLFFFGCEKLRF